VLQCVAVCCSVRYSVLEVCCICSAVCCRDARQLRERCVAVCCSVLQCVAVCCSVLQCVAVCGSVLQHVAVYCSVLQCVLQCVLRCVLQCALQCVLQCVLQCALYCALQLSSRTPRVASCSVLQRVAVCCTVQHCVAVRPVCGVFRCGALQSVAECVALHGAACGSVLQCVAAKPASSDGWP